MMSGKLAAGGNPKDVAVQIRDELESSQDGPFSSPQSAVRDWIRGSGYWEVYVSGEDFAFANYMVDTFHCKVQGDSLVGLAWKVLKA